jgi:hypothetical protein
MSQLFEQTIVRYAVSQAALHLSSYIRARGNSDGDVARLNLQPTCRYREPKMRCN